MSLPFSFKAFFYERELSNSDNFYLFENYLNAALNLYFETDHILLRTLIGDLSSDLKLCFRRTLHLLDRGFCKSDSGVVFDHLGTKL